MGQIEAVRTVNGRPSSSGVLVAVASRCGTPVYVYDTDVVTDRVDRLRAALAPARAEVCFAVKACPNLSILSYFVRLGCGFDVVSEGELRRVVAAGGGGDRTVFSGVGKSADEIGFALAAGVRAISVESVEELRLVETVARDARVTAPVAVRMNPDVPVETHPYIATGLRTSKFGVAAEDLDEAFDVCRRSPAVSLVGVACHIGSQINDVAPLVRAARAVVALADEWSARGAPVGHVDFGGGFGISYSGDADPLDMTGLGRELGAVVAATPYDVLVEPGRFLVAEAGVLLARVLRRKRNGEKEFVVVDAGMNDLIRPALYEARHAVRVVTPSGLVGEDPSAPPMDVVGPVCESACLLAAGVRLPECRDGDLLAFLDAGAYCSSMGSTYNSRRLPPEVEVTAGGSFRVIRLRQAFDDLWRDERPGPWERAGAPEGAS